jgi:hypothetical protein
MTASQTRRARRPIESIAAKDATEKNGSSRNPSVPLGLIDCLPRGPGLERDIWGLGILAAYGRAVVGVFFVNRWWVIGPARRRVLLPHPRAPA